MFQPLHYSASVNATVMQNEHCATYHTGANRVKEGRTVVVDDTLHHCATSEFWHCCERPTDLLV